MNADKTIYLDHAAGTYLLPAVIQRMQSLLQEPLANPSSIHSVGRLAAAELDRARRSLARNLGCKASELIFTSGATESNNLALFGLAQAARKRGNHIIGCATEHASVLEGLKQLELLGFEVSYLRTDAAGQIDLDELQALIRPDTILVTLMWVNNETGLVHPIQAVAEISKQNQILFHCDAVQALGHLPLDLSEVAVDSMSFSGHKIGAPAGIGLLFLRNGVALKPHLPGGSQEYNHRGGTQNTLGAVALATALDCHIRNLAKHTDHYRQLRQSLTDRLETLPGIQFNVRGKTYADHILSCSFPGVDGEALFIRLDMLHLAVSNGSACTSGSQTPSHVLTALGFDKALAQATIRISTGLQTTREDIDRFCSGLEDIINSLNRES